MMGEGGPVMQDEFYRLLEDMSSHLGYTGDYVAGSKGWCPSGGSQRRK